jgi:hypothetical protein
VKVKERRDWGATIYLKDVPLMATRPPILQLYLLSIVHAGEQAFAMWVFGGHLRFKI